MKILIITNKIPYPLKDGGAIATFTLADSLSQLGVNITILTLNTSKHYFNVQDIPEEIRLRINFIDYYINTDIKIADALLNLLFSKYPYNAKRFIDKGFKNLIADILKKEKFDIIQLEGLYLTPYISTIRKHTATPVALRAHNVEHEIWERTVLQEKNRYKKMYLKLLCRRIKKMETNMLNKYDLLVAITERDLQKLNSLGNNKPSQVTPTGYNINNFNNNLKQKTDTAMEYPSVFHIGALDWSPNQEGIIWFIENCWCKILSKMPNLKFYIAGRNAPQWLINKLNKKNIHFCGEVESAQDFINSKALMIVPLFAGSGMRIKIVEAMALSKTIVSTNIGVEGIAVRDKENILIANDEAEFVREIVNIFNDKSKFSSIGENAKNFIAKNFDNINIARELINFYKLNINH